MNFIIFNPDECRAESAGCYGHPLAPTPNLDRLASEGVRFDQCHVQHTVCTPSRASFMTGWYPHVRGHRTLWHSLRPDEPNLLRYMKNAGYDVLIGGKNDMLSPESTFDSVTDWNLGARSTRYKPGKGGMQEYGIDDPRYYSFLHKPGASEIEELHDFRSVDGAIQFLKSKPAKPFVIFLPISFPHCPYWAPGKWHDLIEPEKLPPLRPKDMPGKPDFHALIRQYRRLGEIDEAMLRKINAVYLGMIGVVDHMLGELMQTLADTGLDKDTATFFFSDHGDYAGDYGLVEKWPSGLEDVLTRVPFVAKVPGNKAGHVVKEQVEMFDMMATIMDLAGVKAEHTHFAQSLVPQLNGAAGDKERAVFAEGGYDTHEPNCFEGRPGTDQGLRTKTNIYYPKALQQQEHPESVCRATMIRTMEYKLIRRPNGISELYDLTNDPQELNNRHDDPAYESARSALEKRMLDWYIHTADVVPHNDDPRGFPPMKIE
ncbi:MAG: sulfatase-like hydrolase/transferase [Spirochaetes bacterium]|nr:sulfatase-like hydrolase/transferase [Spirochaetota bacterium]